MLQEYVVMILGPDIAFGAGILVLLTLLFAAPAAILSYLSGGRK